MSGTPTPIVVTGCADCPFSKALSNGLDECTHKETLEPRIIDDLGDSSMLWCPLRTGPALVVLRPEGLKSPPMGTG